MPVLGRACRAAPGPLQHTSGSSWVSDEDAPRWSFVTFPQVMTETWWPASLLERSSGPRAKLGWIVTHNVNTASIPSHSVLCPVDLFCFTGMSQVVTRTLKYKWHTMQRQCLDLHFQSQSFASWAGTERRRRDFWQNRRYCCSDAGDAGTGLHKALCLLQTASLGTTHTNMLTHFVYSWHKYI